MTLDEAGNWSQGLSGAGLPTPTRSPEAAFSQQPEVQPIG